MDRQPASRADLERELGAGLMYAVVRSAALTNAVGWECGCRAYACDERRFVLVACRAHNRVRRGPSCHCEQLG